MSLTDKILIGLSTLLAGALIAVGIWGKHQADLASDANRMALEANSALVQAHYDLDKAKNAQLSGEVLKAKIVAERPGAKIEVLEQGQPAAFKGLNVEKSLVDEGEACVKNFKECSLKLSDCVDNLMKDGDEIQHLRSAKGTWRAIAVGALVVSTGAVILETRRR